MLVGRWWVVRVESDGWKAGRKVRQDPKAETADWIAHLERGARRSMALQIWGGRGSDDIGAAAMREE